MDYRNLLSPTNTQAPLNQISIVNKRLKPALLAVVRVFDRERPPF